VLRIESFWRSKYLGATRPAVASVEVVDFGSRLGGLRPIMLMDARGLKVHGVAYTREQVDREGWTVVF
jgi:hypothetical protein